MCRVYKLQNDLCISLRLRRDDDYTRVSSSGPGHTSFGGNTGGAQHTAAGIYLGPVVMWSQIE